MLEVKDVRFSYAPSSGLSGRSSGGGEFTFNLTASVGEIVVVEGASGVGKSTLLNLIAGFLTPSSGQICFNGQDLTPLHPADRPLSMIFQDSNLFDHLSCRDNIAMGLAPSLKLDAAGERMVDAAMAQLGITPLADRKPPETSGGQQQRVALARGLVRGLVRGQNRGLLLFDEPFSALDPSTRQECINAVLELMASGEFTAVMVSHDPRDAKALGARSVRL